MMEPADAFNRSIRDAEELLARFDAEDPSTKAQTGEVLKRAGMVMALAAWETYVKDRIRAEISIWLGAVEGSPLGNFGFS